MRRLYSALQRKNDELHAGFMEGYAETPERTRDQAETNVRDNLRVTVVVTGAKGEQVITHDVSGLDEANLPSMVTAIALDSSWLMRIALQGREPADRCQILFDFSRPPLIDFSNASGEPTPNASNYRVVAAKATWGVAVYDALQSEFADRTLARAWLHGRYTYDVVLLIAGFPLALWSAWKLWSAIKAHIAPMGAGLATLVVIYLFLLGLNMFRALFGVGRWLWPCIEFRRERQGGAALFWRYVLGAVTLGILASLVYDVAKALLSSS
jgi:hypothetical protein